MGMPQCSRPLESWGIEIKQIAETFAIKSLEILR